MKKPELSHDCAASTLTCAIAPTSRLLSFPSATASRSFAAKSELLVVPAYPLLCYRDASRLIAAYGEVMPPDRHLHGLSVRLRPPLGPLSPPTHYASLVAGFVPSPPSSQESALASDYPLSRTSHLSLGPIDHRLAKMAPSNPLLVPGLLPARAPSLLSTALEHIPPSSAAYAPLTEAHALVSNLEPYAERYSSGLIVPRGHGVDERDVREVWDELLRKTDETDWVGLKERGETKYLLGSVMVPSSLIVLSRPSEVS